MTTEGGPGRVESALGKVGAMIDKLMSNPDEVTARIEKGVEDLRPKLEELKVQAKLGGMDLRDRLMPVLDEVQKAVDDLRRQADAATDPPGSANIPKAAQSEVSKVGEDLRSEEGLT